MNTIYDGSFVLGQTSATNFIAGPGISITQPSEGTVRIANDETVLWSGNDVGSDSFTLSEPITNFEMIRFKIKTDQCYCFCYAAKVSSELVLMFPHGSANAWTTWLLLSYNSSTNAITVLHSKSISHSFTSTATTLGSAFDTLKNNIVEVIGINRKEV